MSGHFSYINVIYYCFDDMHGGGYVHFEPSSENIHRYRRCFYMININIVVEKSAI